MKAKIIGTFLIVNLITLSLSAQDPVLKSAFNGKNLKGWVVPENNIWWSVENGILRAKSGPDKKGSILWTDKEYTDFVIETDFRYDEGTVDTGIFLRSDTEQIQMGISGSLKRDMTGSPYIVGKKYPVEAQNVKEILKPNEWNTIKVIAIAGYYEVWLNNKHVMSYTSDTYVKTGPIGLQLHPNTEMTASFRNIKIGKM
ncbi:MULTISPECIES: DUF1080 domain-containing protein [unclassified Arenibacter]|jgi:hypothetical protein|uniref:3-keto-disaccharide hydrolase n=1 Tax=unclassified Arenibacter TaxID=2615047 RepID=UPI000E34B02D|nr:MULTISPECIES: DUF1080 domain-containing protein [unclassified Arenibacter]MCM4163872.1 DUF1080 domain-containing protein [Arenibacter sp. A80]RFT56582.1 DUF1080 domain-containing protein [Arenibacter sp. P308M17]